MINANSKYISKQSGFKSAKLHSISMNISRYLICPIIE